MFALILTLIALSGAQARPVVWVCNPGHSPTDSAPSNCERVHYSILLKVR